MTAMLLWCAPLALLVSVTLAAPALKAASLPFKRRLLLALSIAGCVFTGGLALYGFLGAAQWIEPIAAQREEHAALRKEISQLHDATLADPADAQAWQQLGMAWMEAQNPPQAVEALRKAVLSSGGQPDIIARYAAALVLANGGVVGEDAQDSIAMALKLDPEQPLARELEALWHKQQSGNITEN